MRPIQQEEIQPALLEVLKAFKTYCAKNDLEFFLFGGSCLGAVRHGGFIPWDDDIDVAMLPEQSDRLEGLIKENPYIDSEKRYRIYLPCELPNFYPFMKVVDTKTLVYERNIKRKYAIGLWVDIFRLGYWPESEKESEAFYLREHRLRQMNKILVSGDLKDAQYKRIFPAVCIAKGLLRLTGQAPEKNAREIELLGKGPKTSWMGNVCWALGVRERCPADWFSTIEDVQFESTTMPMMSKSHEYLSQIYGDYMQLPPEEKRVRHAYEAYWLS